METRRIAMVVPDLFFATRIQATATALGRRVEALEPGAALDRLRASPVELLVLDLHAEGDPLALARALKADPATRAIRIVGFHSHVDTAVRAAAREAGVDRILPRSAFTARLAGILAGGGTPNGGDPEPGTASDSQPGE